MSVASRAADLLARGSTDEAATAVIEALGPEILGYLRAVLRDEAVAGDAFSHLAEGVWRGLPGFCGEASLRAWCYRIAWRAVLSEKRDPFRRRRERLETAMASRVAGRICASTALERERQSDELERLEATLRNRFERLKEKLAPAARERGLFD